MKHVLFRGIDVVSATSDEIVARILEANATQRPLVISFVNPHSFNLLDGAAGRGMRSDLDRMDIVLADGIGVVWAIRLLLHERIQRLSFDLLAEPLFAALEQCGATIALVGGREGVARSAGAKLRRDHPSLRIQQVSHGYLTEQTITELGRSIGRAGIDCILIGAGAPMQERLAIELSRRAPHAVICTCGGYFDQVILPRPYYPAWAYPLRMNWVVRLAKEPRRLWRRYLLGNPRFVAASITWRLLGDRHSGGTGRMRRD